MTRVGLAIFSFVSGLAIESLVQRELRFAVAFAVIAGCTITMEWTKWIRSKQ
jgi:hypothetical protein